MQRPGFRKRGEEAWRELEERALVIGRRRAGAVFALDGLCPHEAYPVAQGALEGRPPRKRTQ